MWCVDADRCAGWVGKVSSAAGLGCAVWGSLGKVGDGLGARLGCLGVVGEARWWLGFGECVVDEAGLARAVVLSWGEEGRATACCFLVFSISLP
jgi:hypothetical protein